MNTYNHKAGHEGRIPRAAVPSEIPQIAEALHKHCGVAGDLRDYKYYVETVAESYVAVFDTYVTGSPGYAGKVIIIVFDGGPEFFLALREPRGEEKGLQIMESECPV